MTACNLEKSFIFDTTVEITGSVGLRFTIHCKHVVHDDAIFPEVW